MALDSSAQERELRHSLYLSQSSAVPFPVLKEGMVEVKEEEEEGVACLVGEE